MAINLVALLIGPNKTNKCIFFIPKARVLLQEQSSSYAQGPKGAGMNRLALWTGDCSWRVGGKRKGKVFEFSSQPLKCCKTMLFLHYTNVIGTWKRLSLWTAVETRGPDLDKVLVCVRQAVVQSSFLCVPCASVAPVTVLNWVILWRGLTYTPDTAWDTSRSRTSNQTIRYGNVSEG